MFPKNIVTIIELDLRVRIGLEREFYKQVLVP
jgi:hypothetical protein